MNQYPIESFSKVSALLKQSSRSLGANGFSVGEEVLPLELAMDEAGPIVWALILHAEAIARETGISGANSTNTLPFTCIVNHDAPFGNEAIIQPGKLPMSVAYAFLDSALEHCLCVGMMSYGYTRDEWDALPAEEKVVPIEPYLNDLKENWVTDLDESASLAVRVQARPVLLDRNQMNVAPSKRPAQSQVLKFPSVR
ncbi:hypothetical protein [Stutzerimonas stutzeri]|uniref:hypothetical protein n=1 Tax=Stutzerimonas stutzeri TaxID=316 RepID=UPI0015E447F4|nr:hypothetical protein [Stutzerimonas stutzeri]MBA1280416.1 hypothetical protein [Stutzerimonas stutzeri]